MDFKTSEMEGKKEKSSFTVSPPDHENVYWACEYILRSLSSSPAGKQNRVKRLHFFLCSM